MHTEFSQYCRKLKMTRVETKNARRDLRSLGLEAPYDPKNRKVRKIVRQKAQAQPSVNIVYARLEYAWQIRSHGRSRDAGWVDTSKGQKPTRASVQLAMTGLLRLLCAERQHERSRA